MKRKIYKVSYLLSIGLVFLLSGCTTLHTTNAGQLIPETNIYKREDTYNKRDIYRHSKLMETKSLWRFPTIKSKPLEVYIIETEYFKIARLIFTYYGEDWIFFDEAIILNGDKDTLSFSFKSSEKNNDVLTAGKVKESGDLRLTPAEVEDFMDLISRGEISIKLSGKYYKEYQIPSEQIEAIKELVTFALKE